jgi:translocation and assembly module TamB
VEAADIVRGHGMARKMKTVFIGAGVLIGLMILLLTAAVFCLNTDYAQGLIQAKVNAVIPGTISWEKSHFSLLRGEFELKNVVLKGASDDELAGLDRLFVDLAWTTLLKGDLTVASLILEKPWATIRVAPDGQINLMEALIASKREEKEPHQEKREPVPFNLILKSLKLLNGSVHYEALANNFKAAVQDIDITAHGNLLKRAANLTLHTGKATLESSKIQAELDHSKAEAALEGGRLDLGAIQINTAASNLSLSGNIGDVFRKPLLNLTSDIAVSLPELRKNLHWEPTLTGQMVAHVAARGAPDNPDMSFHLDYGGGIIAERQIDRIRLDGELKDRLLTVNSLQADVASGHCNLQGEADLRNAFVNGFLAPPRDLESISYKLLLKQKDIRLEGLLSGTNNVKGILHSDLSVHGKGISPRTLSARLALEMSAERLTTGQVSTPVDGHLKTQASLDQGVVTLKQLVAKVGDIDLHTNGHFDLGSEKVAAELTLAAPRLGSTLSSLGVQDVHGEFALTANISGIIKQPVFDFQLQGDQLRFQDITIGQVRLSASLDPSGTLRISQLNLANQGSTVQGGGSIQIFNSASRVEPTRPLKLSVALRQVEMKDFFREDLVSGTIDGDLNLNGSIKALEGALSLRGKDLATEAARLGDLNAALRFSEGTVYLDEAKLHNRNSILRISGTAQILEPKTVKLLKDPKFQANVQGDTLFIEDFIAKLRGKLALAAHLEGSMTNPTGTLDLDASGLDLGPQKLEKLRLRSKLEGQKIWIDPVQITVAPGELIEGTGWFSLKKAYEFTVSSQGIALEHIDKVREQKIADGRLLFDISGSGTFEDPQLRGEIALNQLEINGKALDDIQIRLDLHDQLARISGNLNFDFNGTFHLEKRDFWVSILFDDTELAPYFKVLDQGDLSGMLSGRIEARGNARVLDRSEASVDLSKMDLFFKEKEIAHTQDFKVSWKDEEISIPGLHLRLLKEGRMDIKGHGAPNGALAFEAEGNVPLTLASLFVEDLPDITGDLSLSASMRGTRFHPDIRAEIGLQNLGFTVPQLSQKVHDLNGRIQMTPQAIMIDGIEGQLDTGRFDLAGKIDLDHFQPDKVDVRFNGSALPFRIPDTLDLLFNTTLQVRGTEAQSMIQGEAVILEGTYYKDVNLSLVKRIGEKRREEAVAPSEITQPFLKNMGLDITVKARNAIVVDNNLAHLDVNPDIRISGTLNNPILGGRANVESGTVSYLRRTFVVKKGVVDFLNPYRTEPTLDIEGEVEVRNWTILLAISGTPDELTFKLTSNPSEEEGDILSLLVAGRTTHELIAGEGGTPRSTSQMVAGLISSTFGEDVKNTTGLDILEVDTQGEVGGEGSDRVKVTIGKELSKRTIIKYATESKDGVLTQRAIAEYKFFENILLSGFQDNTGIFGGALKFKLEFR